MSEESVILVVDDEPGGRAALQGLLLNEGYHLAYAGDGGQALALAAALKPDVILLDVMMPGLDGFEVCRRLRADPLLGEVPIVLITALDDYDARITGIRAGADDFLTKPYDSSELRARIRNITQLNRYRRLLTEQLRSQWVMQEATDGFLIIGPSDELRYANPRARLLLNLPPEQTQPGLAGSFLAQARRHYLMRPEEAWVGWPAVPGSACGYLVRTESERAPALWLEVTALHALRGGERLVRLRDVSAQMALQRDLRSFHAMVHHKLRTPLLLMRLSLELLDSAGKRTQNGELVNTALAASQRLADDVAEVVTYLAATASREGSLPLRLGELEAVAAGVARSLELRGAQVNVPAELGDLSISLSRQDVQLVLYELLDNAQRFHPTHSPTVELTVCAEGASAVRLRLSDDGAGLSPQQLSEAWQPYYQGEKRFTGQTRGMGLGLATVAAVVWRVGGSCWLRNREDRPGLIVDLVLPSTSGDNDLGTLPSLQWTYGNISAS